MSVGLILYCDGAAYFDDGSPDYGTFKCGKKFPSDGRRYERPDPLIDDARRDGWKVGPKRDAMCPNCGAPDAKTVRLIDALGATKRVGS